jgi:hypothetical protein
MIDVSSYRNKVEPVLDDVLSEIGVTNTAKYDELISNGAGVVVYIDIHMLDGAKTLTCVARSTTNVKYFADHKVHTDDNREKWFLRIIPCPDDREAKKLVTKLNKNDKMKVSGRRQGWVRFNV